MATTKSKTQAAPAAEKQEPKVEPKQPEQQPEPQQRNIVSPCHGAPVTAYGYATGMGAEAVIDGFCCNHMGCGNEWNADGSILHWLEGA